MICPHCHSNVVDGAKFCIHCATWIDPESNPRKKAEKTARVCPSCNAEIRIDTTNFCPSCGYDLRGKTSKPVEPAASTPAEPVQPVPAPAPAQPVPAPAPAQPVPAPAPAQPAPAPVPAQLVPASDFAQQKTLRAMPVSASAQVSDNTLEVPSKSASSKLQKHSVPPQSPVVPPQLETPTEPAKPVDSAPIRPPVDTTGKKRTLPIALLGVCVAVFVICGVVLILANLHIISIPAVTFSQKGEKETADERISLTTTVPMEPITEPTTVPTTPPTEPTTVPTTPPTEPTTVPTTPPTEPTTALTVPAGPDLNEFMIYSWPSLSVSSARLVESQEPALTSLASVSSPALQFVSGTVEDANIRVLAEFISNAENRVATRGMYRLLFVPDPSQVSGWRLDSYSIESNSVASHFNTAYASSTFTSQYGFYGAQNVIDGRMDTAWVEGVSGFGDGQTITLQADSYVNVHGVKLMLGYQKSSQAFYSNACPTSISVTLSDGTRFDASVNNTSAISWTGKFSGLYYSLDPSFTADFNKHSFVSFGREVYTDSITITIQGSSNSGIDQETCITEIIPY